MRGNKELNMSKRSDAIVKGRDRAAARAMLRATGMDDANFEGPPTALQWAVKACGRA